MTSFVHISRQWLNQTNYTIRWDELTWYYTSACKWYFKWRSDSNFSTSQNFSFLTQPTSTSTPLAVDLNAHPSIVVSQRWIEAVGKVLTKHDNSVQIRIHLRDTFYYDTFVWNIETIAAFINCILFSVAIPMSMLMPPYECNIITSCCMLTTNTTILAHQFKWFTQCEDCCIKSLLQVKPAPHEFNFNICNSITDWRGKH